MATKAKPKYKQYPKYKDLRVGIKVSWYYYESEDDAKLASEAAKHNAQIQWAQGYDFGYQSPGYITKYKEGPYAGLFEVCIP